MGIQQTIFMKPQKKMKWDCDCDEILQGGRCKTCYNSTITKKDVEITQLKKQLIAWRTGLVTNNVFDEKAKRYIQYLLRNYRVENQKLKEEIKRLTPLKRR